MRKLVLIGLLFFSIMLVACGQSSNEDELSREQSQLEDEKPTEEKEYMSENEVKLTVIENLDAIDERMLELHEDHFYTDDHWEIQDTIFDSKNDDKAVKKALSVTKNKLKKLITKDELEDMARAKLYDYFRHLEGASLSSSNIATRFEVIDQTPKSFEVSFLDLETEAGYSPAGTFIVQYEKKRKQWQFNGYEFISADKKPLKLTYEDLEEAYNNDESKLEYIDEVKTPNGTYIVVEQYDHQFGVHVDNSTIDYEFDE